MVTRNEFLDIGPDTDTHPRSYRGLSILGTIIVIAIVLVASFELVYAGKVYPGVSANGVYLGGLTQDQAQAKLKKATADYSTGLLPINYANTTLRIPLNQLGLTYDPNTAQAATAFGRQGSLFERLHAQLRALFGKTTPISEYSFDASKLSPFISQVADDIDSPVQNATLSFNNNQAQVTPAQTGSRVEIGQLTATIVARLADTSTDPVAAPIYQLVPAITTSELTKASSQADSYVSAPVNLSVNGSQKTIDQSVIITWLSPTTVSPKVSYLPDFYPFTKEPSVDITLNQTQIQNYVATIAGSTDQSAQNAALTIQNGRATVFQPSRTGLTLDQADAVKQIIAAITTQAASRNLTLKVAVIKPAVTEDSLSNLGINDLLSEGKTYFPGSTYARLTNVRVGASVFNGVLLAPGEEFSFGKLLGDVGPAQGYLPELVILGNHEEKQYGGGLCQVSSTAYRAALLAGLAINQRQNHSFAISYYTAPYGVPGVDATIYYPQVDLKFTNDTGHYILIQTKMVGSSLTFDFYGTKTKSGQIRGPYFVSGSSDATQPSTTVFYRDILDLAGNVIKTDTITTHYQSSKDFPVQKQYN